jgi:hypothetical protein
MHELKPHVPIPDAIAAVEEVDRIANEANQANCSIQENTSLNRLLRVLYRLEPLPVLQLRRTSQGHQIRLTSRPRRRKWLPI